MPYERLDLKYRPTGLDEIAGNEVMIGRLRTILVREPNERPATYLFQGPSGCGKTTLARIVAKELGCTADMNLHEYNISNMRGIDTAREIQSKSHFKSLEGGSTGYILNECHKATNEFQNAMLEILEEPPDHVFFILCTTEPDKLLRTVRNRCTIFQVSTLGRSRMLGLLKRVCKEEAVEFPNKHLKEIARVSEGSPRQALVILDSIMDIENDEKAYNSILDATISEASILEICQAIINKKPWNEMSTLIKGTEAEPETIRRSILQYMSTVLLNGGDPRIAQIIDLFIEPFFYSGRAGLVYNLYLALQI